jgi:hypothetical protein
MKKISSSSILKALTAGRMRPRQVEEGHRGRSGRGLGRRWAAGALRGGLSAGPRGRGTGGAPAVAARCSAGTAERGRTRRFDLRGAFRQRSACCGGAQGFPGAGAKAGAGVGCGAWARCGAALPCLSAARRWAGGRGAALPRREGRRRVTFWALPRCGPSWGFA